MKIIEIFLEIKIKTCFTKNYNILCRGGAIMTKKSRSLTYRIEQKPGESWKRLRELILYISDKCEKNETFGATKLNKILYYSDFQSYLTRGKPITGEVYQRIPNGPAPLLLCPVRNELLDKGHIQYKPRQYKTRRQFVVIPNRKPDLSLFSQSDLDIVDETIKMLWDYNATEVSVMSHGIAWNLCEEGDCIPYEAAFLAEPNITDKHKERAAELAEMYGW